MQGLKLSAHEIGDAEVQRTQLFERVRAFLTRHEFLVLPFPVDEPRVREIDGVPMPVDLEWMESCWIITVTGHPAVSVSGCFSPEGPTITA